VHLSFNVIGTIICLSAFCIVNLIFAPAFFNSDASLFGIAVAHSVFNLACTLILLPMSSLLEKLAYRLVPETQKPDEFTELDKRLLTTPTIALERCHELACKMAEDSIRALKLSLSCLKEYSEEAATEVRDLEDQTDHLEDIMGTYLVQLSTRQISDRDSAEAAKLLKIIGDLERISDHAANIIDSAEEMRDKQVTFSSIATEQLENISNAINEILDLTLKAFTKNDIASASNVEPLEQVIDILKDSLRSGHISRLQQGICSIETGFVWSDILTNLERTSDHCSNIAGCVIDASSRKLNLHESIRVMKAEDPHYKEQYSIFAEKYLA